jgi:hypothetical protein
MAEKCSIRKTLSYGNTALLEASRLSKILALGSSRIFMKNTSNMVYTVNMQDSSEADFKQYLIQDKGRT